MSNVRSKQQAIRLVAEEMKIPGTPLNQSFDLISRLFYGIRPETNLDAYYPSFQKRVFSLRNKLINLVGSSLLAGLTDEEMEEDMRSVMAKAHREDMHRDVNG